MLKLVSRSVCKVGVCVESLLCRSQSGTDGASATATFLQSVSCVCRLSAVKGADVTAGCRPVLLSRSAVDSAATAWQGRASRIMRNLLSAKSSAVCGKEPWLESPFPAFQKRGDSWPFWDESTVITNLPTQRSSGSPPLIAWPERSGSPTPKGPGQPQRLSHCCDSALVPV